jgi:protoporphyrinogen oxidase
MSEKSETTKDGRKLGKRDEILRDGKDDGFVYKDGKLHSQQSPITYQSYETNRAP